jgi:hypothetical protein
MLIALITILLLGGSGGIELLPLPEDYVKRVKSVIEDKESQKKIESLVKDANEYAKTYNKRVQDMVEHGLELSTDYNTESKEFEPIYTMIYEEREAAQKELVEFHSQLVSQMTKEQWQTLYNFDNSE